MEVYGGPTHRWRLPQVDIRGTADRLHLNLHLFEFKYIYFFSRWKFKAELREKKELPASLRGHL